MVARYHLLLLGLLALPARAAPTGLQDNVVFTDYSPFSRNSELLRRTVSPLLAEQAARAVAASGETLRDQDVDLTREKFALYVPPEKPADGYALMVFIPPGWEASVPFKWTSILDRHGMIFVTAANIGNDASTLERREPIALLAAQNVMNRYPVDPRKVYVGGFSGGARVALRLAVAYPDLFRGALLDAGSDPLSEAIQLPPADLFTQFQQSSRIVYLTGEHDDFHRAADAHSQRSMADWCVYDIDTETMPETWHALADPASVNHALDELFKHKEVDLNERDKCRAEIAMEIDGALRRTENLLATGKTDDAATLLRKTDVRYGGLAAPRSLELAKKLEAPH